MLSSTVLCLLRRLYLCFDVHLLRFLLFFGICDCRVIWPWEMFDERISYIYDAA